MRGSRRTSTAVVILAAFLLGAFLLVGEPAVSSGADEDACVACHLGVTRGIVQEWLSSAHAKKGHSCDACHGVEHRGAEDVEKAVRPTPKVCATCHETQVEQFAKGKHAKAMLAAHAVPILDDQPPAVARKGCIACHRVGEIHEDGSVGRCDSCHTRHLFSKEEASRPEACQNCHVGDDHSHYDMWKTSKHGALYRLDPKSGRAPTCQTCHMDLGDHEVRTGWGFLYLREPMEDALWRKAQDTIVRALGPWGTDAAGMKTRMERIRRLDLYRSTREEWDKVRRGILGTCGLCHGERFAKEHLDAMDQVVREGTLVMAEAIDIVQKLFDEKLIAAEGRPAKVDLLQLYESPTPIEQELYEMFSLHRMRLTMGAFHNNPNGSYWRGWARLKGSLSKIRAMAAELRAGK
jgi:hypothetical protein